MMPVVHLGVQRVIRCQRRRLAAAFVPLCRPIESVCLSNNADCKSFGIIFVC